MPKIGQRPNMYFGAQGWLPCNIPKWRRETLTLSESMNWISHVKGALQASGGRRTPLLPETGNSGLQAYTVICKHMNLQVVNFPRCECVFTRPVTCSFMYLVYIVTCMHLYKWLCFCVLYCKIKKVFFIFCFLYIICMKSIINLL